MSDKHTTTTVVMHELTFAKRASPRHCRLEYFSQEFTERRLGLWTGHRTRANGPKGASARQGPRVAPRTPHARTGPESQPSPTSDQPRPGILKPTNECPSLSEHSPHGDACSLFVSLTFPFESRELRSSVRIRRRRDTSLVLRIASRSSRDVTRFTPAGESHLPLPPHATWPRPGFLCKFIGVFRINHVARSVTPRRSLVDGGTEIPPSAVMANELRAMRLVAAPLLSGTEEAPAPCRFRISARCVKPLNGTGCFSLTPSGRTKPRRALKRAVPYLGKRATLPLHTFRFNWNLFSVVLTTRAQEFADDSGCEVGVGGGWGGRSDSQGHYSPAI